ncbi:MAG: FixH family protein [Xanthomonadales bacterium]|jgi:hypothetical protein|nr:FixH family protein [Xanthomonadales bacterium]
MTRANPAGREPESSQLHPWYHYPWPWVAIAIPAIAVVGGLFTLYLAVTHPDPLVVDDGQYHEIRSGLQAQPAGNAAPPAAPVAREDHDGEH